MEYGDGYCLPIDYDYGYGDAAVEAVRPRQDVDTSLSRLNLAKTEDLYPRDFLDHLLAGKRLLQAWGADKQFFRMSPDFRDLTKPVWNIFKLILFLLHHVRRFNIEEVIPKESYPP